jgi:hypothetical protein
VKSQKIVKKKKNIFEKHLTFNIERSIFILDTESIQSEEARHEREGNRKAG